MNVFQSILLGIVQGLTEFLPVSSSGHLVIIPNLLGWRFPEDVAFAFDVLVQVATLVGVFAYFWDDLVHIVRAFIAGLVGRRPFTDPQARLGWYLIVATIPAGLVGLLIKDFIAAAFSDAVGTALSLFGTAALLVAAERIGRRSRTLQDFGWKDAWWFGVFQALAIIPGISRSGATIAGGMAIHFDRRSAARFSFLMSIPVMLAAGVLAITDLVKIPNFGALLPVFLPGFLAAAVTGYLAIRWLLGYLVKHSLYIFAAYCVLIGLVTLAANLF